MLKRCLIGLAIAFTILPAVAADRVALVIGNGSYAAGPKLAFAPRAASAIAGMLDAMGFRVLAANDLGRVAMRATLQLFGEQFPDAELALFYYAGHAVQVDGRNYLVPVDAAFGGADVLETELVAVADLLPLVRGDGRRPAVALFDACSDGPLLSRLARALGPRGVSDLGLAAPQASGDDLIVGFSSAPGDRAAGCRDDRSPWAEALLVHLPTPGLDVVALLDRVAADVSESTGGLQEPWRGGSTAGRMVLLPEEQVAPHESRTIDAELWDDLAGSFDRRQLEIFIDAFPDSPFAGEARRRLTDLGPEPDGDGE